MLLLEDGQEEITVPISKLPPGSQEGSWLLVVLQGNELISAELDPQKTEEVKERIAKKRALLLKRTARRRREQD